jgi:hypothetical protein
MEIRFFKVTLDNSCDFPGHDTERSVSDCYIEPCINDDEIIFKISPRVYEDESMDHKIPDVTPEKNDWDYMWGAAEIT